MQINNNNQTVTRATRKDQDYGSRTNVYNRIHITSEQR